MFSLINIVITVVLGIYIYKNVKNTHMMIDELEFNIERMKKKIIASNLDDSDDDMSKLIEVLTDE